MSESKKHISNEKVNAVLACISELFKNGGEENIKIENGKRILRCSFHIDLTDTELTVYDIGNAFEECIKTK